VGADLGCGGQPAGSGRRRLGTGSATLRRGRSLGFAGDGGPATGAELTGPSAVAADGHGDLLITDSNRVRMITG
jgi:hypothetical protein